MTRSLTIAIVTIVFALMLLPTSMNLQTSNAASLITVPRDYPTIQSAIDAASPGDTIKVLPGTYTEQLTISKSLTFVGSGARSTIINTPTVLNIGVVGQPYIVEVSNGAKVTIKGFTINGPAGTNCGSISPNGLIGVSVQQGGTVNLDSAAIKGCTFVAVWVGFPPFFPGGPQSGHATVTKTDITDYRFSGIIANNSPTTLTVSRSKIVAAEGSDVVGQSGIIFDFGTKGTITYNKISGNLCPSVPECGSDYLNQFQAFGITAFDAATDSTISYNDLFNNEVGLLVGGNSDCCKVDHNKLTDNHFFGIVIQDGEHTISNTKISGGNVGVLAAAFSVDTVATLDRVIIKGTTTPTQELSVGATAEVVFAPRSVLTSQTMESTSVPISMALPLPN
jgi:nitrous oxidase accessory protein NosD